MLEYIFDIIRWIICKLLFRNHIYSRTPIYENNGIMTYKCKICGHKIEVLDDNIWKRDVDQ